MIYWSLLLHFYQPPTQIHAVLSKVTEESYRPLLKVFLDNPNAKATVNINAVLTEMLTDHGKVDIINGLAELAEKEQIEFTGSGKFHPILPLIPQYEINRQILDNDTTNRKLIGDNYRPQGFFPPEMCYSKSIVEPVLNAGYKWIITSGIACPVDWPLDTIHYIDSLSGKLSVFFRDDVLSNRISFQEIDVPGFLKHLVVFAGDRKDIYIITAMDAETFGHHIKDWEKDFLEDIYIQLRLQNPSEEVTRDKVRDTINTIPEQAPEHIKAVTMSELITIFRAGKAIVPKSSSWSTTVDDMKAGNYYPLWKSPDNIIHKQLWELMDITIGMVNEAANSADTDDSRKYAGIAREMLDLALHSDQFWWASKRPHWEPNMINRGITMQQDCLLNAYTAIVKSGLKETEKREYRYRRIAADDIVTNLRRRLF